MSNFDTRKVKEMFARLFVLAVQNKINLQAFTTNLEKSEFVSKIENDQFSECYNFSLEKIFFDITNKSIEHDTSFGIYNDAYWCGYSYFEIQQKIKKSFAFIFLKLPFNKLIDLYPIYHEMDISSLLDYFLKKDNETTILRLLCLRKGCSIPELSLKTGISKATLAKYNASDESLRKASFVTVNKIVTFFEVPYSLFL